jgi:hypothetical protein
VDGLEKGKRRGGVLHTITIGRPSATYKNRFAKSSWIFGKRHYLLPNPDRSDGVLLRRQCYVRERSSLKTIRRLSLEGDCHSESSTSRLRPDGSTDGSTDPSVRRIDPSGVVDRCGGMNPEVILRRSLQRSTSPKGSYGRASGPDRQALTAIEAR